MSIDTEDLRNAFEGILKVRYGAARSEKIKFERFQEILVYLHRLDTHTDQREAWALSDLELYEDMDAADWIANYERLCEHHAQKLDDPPSR